MSLLLSIVSAALSIIAVHLSYKAYSIAKRTQLYIEVSRDRNGDRFYIEESQPINDGEPIENSLLHLDIDDSVEYWREVEQKRRTL